MNHTIKVIEPNTTKSLIYTKDLAVGAIFDTHSMNFIMKTFQGYVKLNSPDCTWDETLNMEVSRVYEPGTVLELTVGDENV